MATDRTVHTTIKSLRRRLRDLDRERAKVASAVDALEALPDNSAQNGAKPRKRAGGSPLINAAITALRTAGEPLHVMGIVAEVQKAGVQSNRTPAKVRASLVSAMLRRTDMFSKPPGTRGVYGLTEWE